MPSPPFGTASAYTDSFPYPPPSTITISSETCYNLGLFKTMIKQYRKLDDQVIIRLNRAQAQLRDQSRIAKTSSDGNAAMCLTIWNEIMSGWTHRQTLIHYCLSTVTDSIREKSIAGDERLNNSIPRGMAEEQVLVDQLRNEDSIEAIIRKRTLDAFRSRCPFFVPPQSDTTSKAWWDLADSARTGRAPDR